MPNIFDTITSNMEIKALNKSTGSKYRYYDVDSFDSLEVKDWRQIYGVCFYNNQLVVVLNGKANTWSLVGGHPEEGESYEQTLRREIEEEANMKLLKWLPVGVQEVKSQEGHLFNQLRAVCLVEPIGDFVSDPAETITEVKLIDPQDYKEYFDWGEIGERIIKRALELKDASNFS